MKQFSEHIKHGLVWLPELGMGRYPVPKDRPYDQDYFARYRKLAKLIPMLATSQDVISHVNRQYVIDIQSVYTTAFTTKPVSMKYRGIYKLTKRGEGFLNYSSVVREQSPQEIFKEWYRKYAN
ncbi:TPA: hypothetical protein N2N62_001749 [Citrobacter freundii]|nr:hypothetical protein [Citrobacter freundii]HCL6562290.1 hypothetical protein [Citrobacter freundii]HED3636099.1 hypothetical protein [Citrobacter freundii]HED3673977.1 hypothetical protein [Citrobacter freundii]HED3769047.1 hypothetical protein [Citrobacter freundii]